MHTSSISRSARGFTLIELLTVIAIIGILAAIIIPTVGAVRKKAANARDGSNLRQIGTALQLYANDNKNRFPTDLLPVQGTTVSGGAGDRPSFHESVDRYLSERSKRNPGSVYNYVYNDIWHSRSAEAFSGFSPQTSASFGTQGGPIAYSSNPYAYRASVAANNAQWGGRLTVIPSPSQIVIVAEVNMAAPGERFGSMDPTKAPDFASNVASTYRVSRDGNALYLFCDGRVASLPGDQSEPALAAANRPNIWRWW